MGLSRGNFWGFRGLLSHKKSGECHDIQRKKIIKKILIIKCTNIYIILLQLSRAKPGNPASIYIYALDTTSHFGTVSVSNGQ